jgi:hypothetical protein
MMAEVSTKSLGCLALVIGGLSVIIMPWLGAGTPGRAIFNSGRDDGIQLLMSVIMDMVVFGAISYGFLYLAKKFSGGAKNP